VFGRPAQHAHSARRGRQVRLAVNERPGLGVTFGIGGIPCRFFTDDSEAPKKRAFSSASSWTSSLPQPKPSPKCGASSSRSDDRDYADQVTCLASTAIRRRYRSALPTALVSCVVSRRAAARRGGAATDSCGLKRRTMCRQTRILQSELIHDDMSENFDGGNVATRLFHGFL